MSPDVSPCPDFLPDRLEAGTHNMAGVAGLLEGLRFVKLRGTAAIGAHERQLAARMGEGLAGIPGMTGVPGGRPGRPGGGAVLPGGGARTARSCASLLDDMGFALRAGLHCAPLAHTTAGTLETGTVRASVSAFTTVKEVREVHPRGGARSWTAEPGISAALGQGRGYFRCPAKIQKKFILPG